MQPKNDESIIKACKLKVVVCMFDFNIPQSAMFKVQEEIASYLSGFREVIKDPSLFVYVRDRKFLNAGACRKQRRDFLFITHYSLKPTRCSSKFTPFNLLVICWKPTH